MLVRPHCGEMQMEHIPGWRERAMLQSLKPEAVRFPPKTTETQKRQLVASVVPPLFAACLSKAVFPHLSMGVQKHNMRSMMTSLAVRSEEEIDSAFFLKTRLFMLSNQPKTNRVYISRQIGFFHTQTAFSYAKVHEPRTETRQDPTQTHQGTWSGVAVLWGLSKKRKKAAGGRERHRLRRRRRRGRRGQPAPTGADRRRRRQPQATNHDTQTPAHAHSG